MKYEMVSKSEKLIFLKDFDKWVKGDSVVGSIYRDIFSSKRIYFVDSYSFDDDYLLPIDELRDSLILHLI